MNPYFYLYTTEVGTAVVDCWKIYKLRHRLGGCSPMVNQFVDIFLLAMIEYAKTLTEDSSEIEESSTSDVLSVTCASISVVNSMQTQILISSKK